MPAVAPDSSPGAMDIMICNRCGHELPSDTPVCRACGPVTLDPGRGALPPLPSVSFAIPGLAPIPSSAPVVLPAPLATPPPIPTAPPASRPASTPARQSKAQRRRAALAARARGEPDGTDGAAEAVSPVADDEPSVASLPRPRPVTLVARLDLFVGAAELVLAWAILAGRLAYDTADSGLPGHGVTFAASAVLRLAAAGGLLLVSPLGWYAHLGVVASGILWGSWSDVAAIATAVYLLRPGVKLLLSGRDRATLEAQDCGRIREDVASPVLVPVTVVFLGLVATLRYVPLLWVLVTSP
jgi:hypothetical protein